MRTLIAKSNKGSEKINLPATTRSIARNIDKKKIKRHIQNILAKQSQVSIQEVIEKQGGLSQGLPELFGFMDVIKDFKHTVNDEQQQRICFDQIQQKTIQIPEIIVIRT